MEEFKLLYIFPKVFFRNRKVRAAILDAEVKADEVKSGNDVRYIQLMSEIYHKLAQINKGAFL